MQLVAPALLAPLTVWGTLWDQLSDLEKEFFTDGSAITVCNAALWKATVYHPTSSTSLEEGSLGLTQQAEPRAVYLALR